MRTVGRVKEVVTFIMIYSFTTRYVLTVDEVKLLFLIDDVAVDITLQ